MKPRWLPNWDKDLRKYPNPEWAWQFLRRNPEYQRLWAQLIQPHYDPADVKRSLDRADRETGFRRISTFRSRFRLEEVRYPLEPFKQRFGISTVPPDPSEPTAKLHFSAAFIRYAQKPFPWPGPGSAEYGLPLINDAEVLVWFDLNWSIDQQLANAKRLLRTRAAGKKLEPFRFQPKTYQRYLRLLDARAVGAKNSRIASILYPNVPNKYPEYNGNRQVSMDVRAAERLRDRDFLRIVRWGK
jgi:Proteobacterial transcriptional regulator-like domain/T6SS, Transcription factor, DNA binding domain